MQTINCKGKLIELSQPCVMGIINVTPDSFYDGGKTTERDSILKQAEKMLNEGATFLDIGGYSSRPNADDISVPNEKKRVLTAIETIIKEFPDTLISVDTFRSEVASAAIEAGAALVNDISAGKLDKGMLPLIAKYNVPYVMMHMRGTPQTMQTFTTYNAIVEEITFYFSERIAEAKKQGINDIIVDVGFGFSKDTAQNFTLLRQLAHFKILELPLLVGISRKSMIYKTLQTTPQEALNGTTSLHMAALERGATILRVHDVKEAMECIELYKKLKK